MGRQSLQDHVAVVHIELGVPFGKIDGRALLMDIARPDPQPMAPLPAVIDIHGDGWAGSCCCASFNTTSAHRADLLHNARSAHIKTYGTRVAFVT